jgi:general secretion pathway protein N
MSLSGWPWQWRADLAGGDLRWLRAPGSALLAGRLMGEVRLAGSWRRCLAASGSWQGDALQVLVPRRLVLGEARLQVDCHTAPWLQGVFERSGQHRLELRLSLANWRGQVRGTAQPGSEIASMLQDIGWLKAGQSQVSGRF